MDGLDSAVSRRNAAASSIRSLRTKLLDLGAANPLVSFNHGGSRGTRTNVRAVDLDSNVLLAQMCMGRSVQILPLPPSDDEPADERTDEFVRAVEAARRMDEGHRSAVSELAEDQATSPKAAALERELRDRVRAERGMPGRRASKVRSLAEHASEHGIDPDFELSFAPAPVEGEPPSAAPRTVTFRALMLPDPLQRTMAKMRETARTYLEEMGVHTLHVAFGFLEWYESDNAEKPLVSPLILMPVDLGRTVVRGSYCYTIGVAASGEDPEVNLTLSERLHRDFRMRLPDLEEGERVEAYLAKVADSVCRGRPRWRVRSYVTLGQFPFARLAMFKDLDDAAWAEGLAAHPLLARLLGGGGEGGGAAFAEEHDVDGPEVAAKVPLLVLEADASQHSAVHDVMSGKNLVIEGPPGTGKSQTIANMVAAALASNLRVLFMAEKQAALQVVRDRLGDVGLGDFCLDLHSGKAKKTEVLDSLRRRMERRAAPTNLQALETRIRELDATKASLNGYVASLNAPIGSFGATVHDVLWGDRRRRSEEGAEARPLDSVVVPDAVLLTDGDIARRKSLLVRFELAAAPVLAASPTTAAHPWFGMERFDLPGADVDEAQRALADAADAYSRVVTLADALAAFGVQPLRTLPELERAALAVAALDVPEDIDPLYFRALSGERARREAEGWIPLAGACRDALERLAPWGMDDKVDPEPVLGWVEKLQASLANDAEPDLRLAAVRGWGETLTTHAEQLNAAAATATRVATVLGLDAPRTCGDVDTLLAARTLVLALEPGAIVAMSPALCARDAGVAIAAAADHIGKLRERAAELEATYRLEAAPASAELRQAAITLREAGVFAFLSAKTKHAVRTYETLRKAPAPVPRPEVAASLTAVADHLDAVSAVDTNVTWRETLGGRLRGLATDTVEPAMAAVWATRVRADMAWRGECGIRIRDVLLRGDGDRLELLSAAMADVPDVPVPQFRDRAGAIEVVADEMRRRSAEATRLATELLESGIRADVTVAEFPDLIAALRHAVETERCAALPPELEALLGFRATLPKDRSALIPTDPVGPLMRALATATAVSACGLPVADRARLQDLTPDTLARQVMPTATTLVEAARAARDTLAKARELLGIDDARFFGCAAAQVTAQSVAARLRVALEASHTLGDWLTYLIERRHAEENGLSGLLALWDERVLVTALPEVFDRVLYRNLARAALKERPVLERHTGLAQEEARARFRTLDGEIASLRRRHLAETLTVKRPPRGVEDGKRGDLTEGALLDVETAKQKRHIPVRQLLDRASYAVQALKPCFMMSPLSVAQFLRSDGLRFDLLVIDEASQMRPEDALGAIARSARIVVVGDPKQLPPTAFFAGGDGDSGDEEEEGDDRIDAESILDLAQGIFRPARRLRWHYRSRHGSLIAFSNRRFYDDDLMVFPSPAESGGNSGVSLVNVGGIYRARGNEAEVEAVCAAAAEHMRTRPHLSLGIATMNGVQRDLILERMDQIAASDPEVEAYRSRWSEKIERFFVKNLETVQGDERDVILISTVFGPAQPGARVLQRFGPINGASGHRRLNVLFTRAKHRVQVFTSMSPADITAEDGVLTGASVLKGYLAYAADGRLDAGVETGRSEDSDFEVFVKDRLARAGYTAVPQVGVAGFFIDLAIRHPDVPGTFLLGVECDGASYHSSRSARDRDILRQQVLEKLGWTIYRIWSTDWFRDPAGQTRKMLGVIEDLRGHGGNSPSRE